MSGCGAKIKTGWGNEVYYCGEPVTGMGDTLNTGRRLCQKCGGDFTKVEERDATKPEPQPNTEIVGEVVIDELVKDLEERSRIGQIKYGQKLCTFNGRNCLMDAYQEALDLCMYLKQLLMEEERKINGKTDNL